MTLRKREAAKQVERASRGWRAIFSDEGGAVMAEAAIMLPVLIAIWGLILYIHFGFRDAERNLVTLRDHTWVHAFSGCNSSLPAPSRVVEGGSFDGESSGGIGGLASALRSLATTLFQIEEFGTQRDTTFARPRSIGGGTRTVSWQMRALCNEDQPGDDDIPFIFELMSFGFF
jgi:hypothetical protein